MSQGSLTISWLRILNSVFIDTGSPQAMLQGAMPRHIDAQTVLKNDESVNGVFQCISCPNKMEGYYHYAIGANKTGYCSFNCLLQDVLKRNPSVCSLLTGTQPLTNDEKLILQRCATLMHYCRLPLIDGIMDDRSLLYCCDHEKLSSLLEKSHKKIGSPSKDTALWQSAAALAQIFGADVFRFTIVLGLFQQLKKDYLNTLLEKMRGMNYKPNPSLMNRPFSLILVICSLEYRRTIALHLEQS